MPKRMNFGFDRFSGLYLWALFIVVFGVWTPSLFLTSGTIHGIASEQSLVAILAIAVLIPLAAGVYDLSVGSVANLATVLVVVLQTNHGWSMWTAVAVSLAVGAIVGLVNGFFVVVLRVSSFITTLGMSSVVVAFLTIVTGGIDPTPPINPGWSNLTQTNVLGFQSAIVFTIVIAFIAWWWLEHTPAGRYLYATGANPEAARLTGIRVGRWTWISLVVSGTLSALVGVLYASLDGPSLSYGQSLLLPAFAAAFLGSTQLKPGEFNVWGTMIAIFVLATGIQGLQLVTGVAWLPDMFYGVALLAAVSFALWRQRSGPSSMSRDQADDETPGQPPHPRSDIERGAPLADHRPLEPTRSTTEGQPS